MEPLLDDFDFDCALNQQKRTDRLHQISSNHNHPFHGMHTYIDEQVHHQTNVILRKQTTKNELATYLHACCLFPVLSTFVSAIKKGHFSTWPGLTDSLINKHLKKSIHRQKDIFVKNIKIFNLQTTKINYLKFNNILLVLKLKIQTFLWIPSYNPIFKMIFSHLQIRLILEQIVLSTISSLLHLLV